MPQNFNTVMIVWFLGIPLIGIMMANYWGFKILISAE